MRIAIAILGLTVTLVIGEEANPKLPPALIAEPLSKVIQTLPDGRLRIGAVILDKAKRQLSFPARVNLRDVLIEYAVVGKIGKLHESLLATDVPPTHIHIAMLLLGTKDLRPKSEEKRLPPGQPIDIQIRWEASGKRHEGPIEDWIIIEQDKRPIGRGMWVYSGARIDEGYFTANTNESIVAIILDIDALANNPRLGNENDEIWYPNESRVPPVGTPVEVIFRLLDHYEVPPTAEPRSPSASAPSGPTSRPTSEP